MRRVDFAVDAHLAQRRRLIDDVEGENAGLVPGRNRLDERARRELAATNGTNAGAGDACPNRIGDAAAEVPGRLVPDFIELYDVLPDYLRRSRNINRRDGFVSWGNSRDAIDQRPCRNEEERCREADGTAATLGDLASNHTAE